MTTFSDSWSTEDSEYAELHFLPTILEIAYCTKFKSLRSVIFYNVYNVTQIISIIISYISFNLLLIKESLNKSTKLDLFLISNLMLKTGVIAAKKISFAIT